MRIGFAENSCIFMLNIFVFCINFIVKFIEYKISIVLS